MGRDVHSLTYIQHFLKFCFEEAVVECDMPKPFKCPSLDDCQKRFLWTLKEVEIARHTVVGLVFQVGDAETFPKALGFESLDPFSHGQQAGSMFHNHRRGWR